MSTARVTVTLPAQMVEDIDRVERNRSAFVVEAVRRELHRRRREQLLRSLESPHPETRDLATAGFDVWARGLPKEDLDDIIDAKAGKPVRWVPKRGWVSSRQRPSTRHA